MCADSQHPTNLDIDPRLFEQAVKVSGERIETAAVTRALREYVARHEQRRIVERFGALPLLAPDRLQVGTSDALLAQLCIRHELAMLTTDRDFELMARHVDLRLWAPWRGVVASVRICHLGAGQPN